MWEMLTGKVPWDGLSVADMKARVTLDFTYALTRLDFSLKLSILLLTITSEVVFSVFENALSSLTL